MQNHYILPSEFVKAGESLEKGCFFIDRKEKGMYAYLNKCGTIHIEGAGALPPFLAPQDAETCHQFFKELL